MDFSLVLKIGFTWLPFGASLVIASKTVRQGGNIRRLVVLRDALVLIIVGVLCIAVSVFNLFTESQNSVFDLIFGAGEALLFLGLIEFSRFVVFGKPQGSSRLKILGMCASALGFICIVVWIIGNKVFGL